MLLGDSVKSALAIVGITEQRVSAWLGRPCNCASRQRRLNELHVWAGRILRGEVVPPMHDLTKHWREGGVP